MNLHEGDDVSVFVNSLSDADLSLLSSLTALESKRRKAVARAAAPSSAERIMQKVAADEGKRQARIVKLENKLKEAEAKSYQIRLFNAREMRKRGMQLEEIAFQFNVSIEDLK